MREKVRNKNKIRIYNIRIKRKKERYYLNLIINKTANHRTFKLSIEIEDMEIKKETIKFI